MASGGNSRIEESNDNLSLHYVHNSQDSITMPPPPARTQEGVSKSKSGVWQYYEKVGTCDSKIFKTSCLVCKNNPGGKETTFNFKVGSRTGTLTRHLENRHNLTKDNHEQQHGEDSQSQISGYYSQSAGGGKRVLDEKRTSLSPDVVKILICKKDWDQAEKRQQGCIEEETKEDDDDPWMLMDSSSESGTSTSGCLDD